MAKNAKKILVLVLTFVLCAMQIAMPALADDAATTPASATTTTETTSENSVTDPATGNVTVEITVHEETTTTDPEAPVQLDRDVTTTTTTVMDSEGDTISTVEVVEGTQTTVTTEEDTGAAPGQTEVTVDLVPGETTTGQAVTETVTGDVQKGAGDKEYSSTTTTVVDRTVEATTEGGDVRVDTSGQGEYNPIQTDRDMVNVEENQLHTHPNTSYKQVVSPNAIPEKPEEGGYDFLYNGFGQMSDFYVGTEKGEEEAHSGALQFELLQNPQVKDGQYTNDMEKDRFTAYCVDLTTGAAAGYWYRLENLEDAGYYDEEAASHIRSIASSGYWGTNAGEDAENPALGSLEKLKKEMKAYAADLGLTEEQIDAITPGQALAATQAAIWSYANATTGGAEVDEDRLIITGYKAPIVPTDDDFAKAQAVYTYLRSLEPTAKTESTQIIDMDSYIKENSMSITVGDMTNGESANEDDDQNNNIYDVSVNFALVVTPSENGDDLIVQVVSVDAEGNTIIEAQGRIAGDSSNDEGFNDVAYNAETGEYSLSGLHLAENSNFSFDLKLSGTQYLQEGVYIFTSEERNGATSQTFVGLAEGHKEVNVSQNFIVNFDVDETNVTTEVKRWRTDSSVDHSSKSPDKKPTVSLVVTANVESDPAEDGAIEILDEAVPLAAAPETGDNSIVYAVMSLVSLCGIILLAKKRRVA